MGYDPEGTWVHLVIGAAIGLIAGLVGQLIADVTTSIVTKQPLKFSGWESYVGSAVGGALGGITLAATNNKALADAVTGYITTGTTMLLTNATGETNYSKDEILYNSLVTASASVVLGKISFSKSSSAINKPLLNPSIKPTFIQKLNDNIIGGLTFDVFLGLKSSL